MNNSGKKRHFNTLNNTLSKKRKKLSYISDYESGSEHGSEHGSDIDQEMTPIKEFQDPISENDYYIPKRCEGCFPSFRPGQRDHMLPGGCLYIPSPQIDPKD